MKEREKDREKERERGLGNETPETQSRDQVCRMSISCWISHPSLTQKKMRPIQNRKREREEMQKQKWKSRKIGEKKRETEMEE